MYREYKKVTSVKTIQHKNIIVYNLHVEDDNSFVANNIIVGNTNPHFPPLQVIYDWLMRKRGDLKIKVDKKKTTVLNGKTYNAGVLKIAWAIAYKMSKEGTEPHPYLRPSFNLGKSKSGDFLRKAMKE